MVRANPKLGLPVRGQGKRMGCKGKVCLSAKKPVICKCSLSNRSLGHGSLDGRQCALIPFHIRSPALLECQASTLQGLPKPACSFPRQRRVIAISTAQRAVSKYPSRPTTEHLSWVDHFLTSDWSHAIIINKQKYNTHYLKKEEEKEKKREQDPFTFHLPLPFKS